MNAIEASERLRVLENAIKALDYSIEEANRRADVYGRHALRVLLSEVTMERDELKRKLSEVSI